MAAVFDLFHAIPAGFNRAHKGALFLNSGRGGQLSFELSRRRQARYTFGCIRKFLDMGSDQHVRID